MGGSSLCDPKQGIPTCIDTMPGRRPVISSLAAAAAGAWLFSTCQQELFVSSPSLRGSSRGALVQRQVTYDAPAWIYNNPKKTVYPSMQYINDIGYFPDGTPMNTAGNAMNHPESIGPDLHQTGSALPLAKFVNDVGYLPDGTPMHTAGNQENHPETIGVDPHVNYSPLLKSDYEADVGYFVDGTEISKAGNALNHA